MQRTHEVVGARTNSWSSSSDQGPLTSRGSSAFFHRCRHCTWLRLGTCAAISFQLISPYFATATFSCSSSSGVQCRGLARVPLFFFPAAATVAAAAAAAVVAAARLLRAPGPSVAEAPPAALPAPPPTPPAPWLPLPLPLPFPALILLPVLPVPVPAPARCFCCGRRRRAADAPAAPAVVTGRLCKPRCCCRWRWLVGLAFPVLVVTNDVMFSSDRGRSRFASAAAAVAALCCGCCSPSRWWPASWCWC